MSFDLTALLNHLQVTSEYEDSYRGVNLPGKRKAVYGGQVIAQALSAAIQSTASDRRPHSLHCHFLRAGNTELPIHYRVQRIRDGGSFSTRYVTASQNDKEIFLATISFQKPETGLQHQQAAPVMKPREGMISEWQFWQQLQRERPELTYLRPDNFTALDILSDFRQGVDNPTPQPPEQSFWFRAKGTLTSQTDHQLIIAFQSDLQFLNTALHAHPHSLFSPQVMAASLDHCLWFFDDINSSEWHYYDMQSPVSASGRGLNHGYFYTEAGKLVAATTQEGLMRVKR